MHVLFMTTPLGRSVPMNDWKSINSDTIMKVLYGVARSPFNPNNAPVAIDALPQVTGLELLEVANLVAGLEALGFVEVINALAQPKGVRISPRGIDWAAHLLLRMEPTL